MWDVEKREFYHSQQLCRNLIGQFAIVDNAPRLNVSRNMSRTERIALFDIDFVIKFCCKLTRLRLASPQKFDHRDEEYRCRYEYRQR